ncbi:MAG: hypothetical protein WD076_02295, partial [Parvularculaceae bacterium]
VTASGVAIAQEDGYGPDPDGDGNPATNTQLFVRIGDGAEASLDPPWRVVTFEKSGGNGDEIRAQTTQGPEGRRVSFSKGLTRQICDGPRYFRYDSQCTYLRAPSGAYAALYRDDYNRPLRIRFDNPVCAAALAVYPTGGEEGEEFKITLRPYIDDSKRLGKAIRYRFTWTNDTFRWRLMAITRFLGDKVSRVDVKVESVTYKHKMVRFLIDDVAFIEDDCRQYLDDLAADAPVRTLAPDDE